MDMKALVEAGRAWYAARRYERALKQFTRALGLCPCNRGQKRKRCECKDYEAVAARDGSMFEEAMFTCECYVGDQFDKCDDSLHLMALDYRAATFEAMDELPRAERDAKWMLELAPGRPEGYLRLGKVARLRKDSWFAWKVYSAGVDANKHTPLSSSPKLQQLHQALLPLQIRFRRKDPMCLPLEIVHNIFADFDVIELTKCIRVSKVWKQVLEGDHSQRLWRFLVFPTKLLKPPPKIALEALIKRSGGSVRKIVIPDPAEFRLSQAKLSTLLRHSKSLQHLELGPALEPFYFFPNGFDLYKNLCHLTMDTYNCWERSMWASHKSRPGGLISPDEFLECVASTLEYLDLFAIPPCWHSTGIIPEFPRLRVLRLEHKEGLMMQNPFPVFFLAYKTPRLEQLSLKNMHLESESWRGWIPLWDTLWCNLRAFVFAMPRTYISPTELDQTYLNVSLINSLHVGKNLEHLDLEVGVTNEDAGAVQRILSDADDLHLYGLTEADGSLILRHNQFQNLQSLRLQGFVHSPRRMRNILEAAVANGKLHTFDLVFPLVDLELPLGEESTRFLEGYHWLRGLDTIRCMGVSSFSFPHVPPRDAEPALPSFLASFPNLETLSLSSNHSSPEACLFIMEEVMKRTSIRTLYQDCVKGALMDQLNRLGHHHKVKVVHGMRPRKWPIPVDG